MTRPKRCGFALAALLLALPGPSIATPAAPQAEKATRAKQINLTAQRLSELQKINHHVNRTITEVSDLEQYGREDVWTLPVSGKGDCEDFALLKRKLLTDRGWPASALLVTAVQTAEGEPHAVLVARTNQGDYALDNKRNDIRPVEATGYVILSQQSQTSPGTWIAGGTGAKAEQPAVDLPVR
jgi:predicted transglutaminase-like cysteine proteinase